MDTSTEYPEYPVTYATFDANRSRYVHVVSHVEHNLVTSQMDMTHLATFFDADDASDYARACSSRIEKQGARTASWIDVQRVEVGHKSTGVASRALAKEPCPVVYN